MEQNTVDSPKTPEPPSPCVLSTPQNETNAPAPRTTIRQRIRNIASMVKNNRRKTISEGCESGSSHSKSKGQNRKKKVSKSKRSKAVKTAPSLSSPASSFVSPKSSTKETKQETKEVRAKEPSNTKKLAQKSDELSLTWLNSISKDKIVKEFEELTAIESKKPSTAFESFPDKNRTPENVVYDENRVVLNRSVREAPTYINASRIAVEGFSPAIVAQLPLPNHNTGIEDFWYMIYQEKVTIMLLICTEDESVPFFPSESGSFAYYGKMFVNNRKREKDSRLDTAIIEILPEGNSDSVMCRIYQIKKWLSGQKMASSEHTYMINYFLEEIPISQPTVCVVSENGNGRACSALAGIIAITMLNRDKEPKIFEHMKLIKEQRKGATENLVLYIQAYAMLCDHLVRVKNSPVDAVAKERFHFLTEWSNKLIENKE